MTFSEAIKGFFITRALDLSTITADIYRWTCNILIDYMGDIELAEIDTIALRKYFFYLKTEYRPTRWNKGTSPLSGASIDNAWTAFRSFYNWANDFSLEHGFRILSAYATPGGRLWITTEADRSATTFLLPEEY